MIFSFQEKKTQFLNPFQQFLMKTFYIRIFKN